MKKILMVIGIAFLLFSCSSTEQIIKSNKKYKSEKITCLQKYLSTSKVFSKTYTLDSSMPSLTVYAAPGYSKLTSKERDLALKQVGKEYQECYPDDFRPLTLWLDGEENSIITVIFVTRDQ